MADVSEKTLDELKDWLKKASATWRPGFGVCKGKVTDLKGVDLKGVAPHSACHAWVSYAFQKVCFGGASLHSERGWDIPYVDDAGNFLTLSCHSKVRSKDVCSPEACDFLVLWMAKESPFSQFILNRDDDESLTEGGVIILCGPEGATLPQAMWICKVLRFITEGAKAADTFMTLVKGGVDPMLAVYVASHVRAIHGATFGYTGTDGHSTVFFGDTDLRSLVLRNLNPKAYDTRTVFKSPGRSEINPPSLVNFCRPVRKPDGWGGYVEGRGVDKDEFISRVLEWQNKKLGDIVKSTPFNPVPPPPLPTSSTVYLELDL